MIRKLLWFGIAATAGVVVYRQVTRRARAYTPVGFAGSVQETAAGVLDSMRDFVADVRAGMAEREAEIHAALADNAEHGQGAATVFPEQSADLWPDLSFDPSKDLEQFLNQIGQRHQREGETD